MRNFPFASQEEILSPPLIGDLNLHPLPFLLGRIGRQKLEGYLRLKRGDLKKEIVFKQGVPVQVQSNIINECLGRVLERVGEIDSQTYKDSLNRMKSEKRKQGEILIEMGAITPHVLSQVLQRQAREKFIEIFSWKEGAYRFFPSDGVTEPENPLGLNLPVLIFEGVKTRYPKERIQAFLENYRGQSLIRSEQSSFRIEEMNLKPKESRILKAVDGNNRLEDLVRLFGEESTGFLYTLIILGILVPAVSSPEGKDISPPTPQQAGERVISQTEGKINPGSQDVSGDKAGVVPEKPSASGSDRENEAEVLPRLQSTYDKIRDQDFFGILGVEQRENIAGIKKAYFQMAKDYHPDRFSGFKQKEIREMANWIFSLVSQAFSEIGNEEGRKKYLESLRSQEKDGDLEKEAQNLVNAEIQYQKGEVLLKRKEYDQAISAFEWASRINPKEPEYIMQLGWSLFKKYSSEVGGEEKVEEAIRLIKKAIEANSRLDQGFYYLGVISKLRGQEQEAERYFAQAVEINPRAMDAVRELRVIQMRKGKATEKKGSFKRWFKR